MADGDGLLNTPIDPQVIASLMAGNGVPSDQSGSSEAAVPSNVSAQSVINPPTQQADLSAGAGTSQLPPQIMQMMQGQGNPPMVAGGLTSQQAAARASQPPTPQIGGLPGLIMDILKPTRNVAPGQAVPSKLDRFEGFLGNFLQSLSAGFSSEGHGPGAAYRGAGAAFQAPYQQQLQQYQLGIQQKQLESQEQLRAAQEEFNRQRAREYSSVTVPQIGTDGKIMKDAQGNPVMIQMPAKEAGPYMARLGAAGEQATSREDVAKINAASKGALQDPRLKVLNDAMDSLKNGDSKGFQDKLNEVSQMSTSLKPPVIKNNESEWIARVIANPNDKEAKAALDLQQERREKLMEIRGESMGKGRLWQLQTVYNPETQTTDFMTGFQLLDAQQNGKSLVPVGRMPQDKLIAIQQLQSEATPALKQVRDSLKAFDNPEDRAIFARVLNDAGTPKGDLHAWVSNVVDQALKSGLSEDGKNLARAEGRLAETLGRMRGVLGLQATDAAMALTMKLMPSATTPDAKYAKEQLDTLDSMIGKAVNIPAFTGKNQPLKPLDDATAQSILDEAKGDADKARDIAKSRNYDTKDQKGKTNKDGFTLATPPQ